MLAACEAGDLFALLEGGSGGAGGVRDAADAFAALYASVREPWVTRALLLYHARTGSTRAIELLARAPEPHARHLLDALHEQLRAERPARHQALAALAPLVARRPPWLHRLPPHPLAHELLRAARTESDALPLLHALLALAALAPAAPALVCAAAPQLADALLRPSTLEPPPAPPARAHLALAQRALFLALYATHPCTLLDALRERGEAAERALPTLAASVRLHPALVTGSRALEADRDRWARVEIHDVVAECRRLSLGERAGEPAEPPTTARPPPAWALRSSPAPGSAALQSLGAGSLRPGAEPWFPLVERCGADSAPHTPLPADTDADEPPEPAVEATPENTPARETSARFRFPADSNAVRAIGRRSRPASPPRRETSPQAQAVPAEAYAGRLARLALERRAADSPVAFAGALPAGVEVARPEPSRPLASDAGVVPEPSYVEDREVLELTAQADDEDEWADLPEPAPGHARSRVRDPRRGLGAGHRAAGPRAGEARCAPALRRAASCGPRAEGPRRAAVAVQTVDTWPEPYEFLVADFFRNSPDETGQGGDASTSSEALDVYVAELYAGRGGRGRGDLAEQLALAHAQLLYERWRRDAHAERNRRLLGRCRRVRALELQAAALGDRLRATARERDELRARLARGGEGAASGGESGGRSATGGGEGQGGERAARLRAEAALHEARRERDALAGELARARGDSLGVARHVRAMARAAATADTRASHVRRLRRELLLLAEREARLGALAGAPRPAPSGDARGLRLALAHAEEAAGAAAGRAEAATARCHELERQLAAREAALGALRRAARAAGEEALACRRALEDKYTALLRVVRAEEEQRLERLAGE